MKLKRIAISNCCRIKDIDIEVRDNLILIGPNGAGKTTVLLCLDMLLGMDEQRMRETVADSFIRDTARPLSVEGTFCNLTDE
ncbi:MAG: AAA family ATPase, partial [Eggerthellaceae bacterium]|nr:AAA family ATPase [Eggerthellaceae bacterium]